MDELWEYKPDWDHSVGRSLRTRITITGQGIAPDDPIRITLTRTAIKVHWPEGIEMPTDEGHRFIGALNDLLRDQLSWLSAGVDPPEPKPSLKVVDPHNAAS